MEEQAFVTTESKRQKKKKKQRSEADGLLDTPRSAKQTKTDARSAPIMDNAAYAAVFGADAKPSVIVKADWAAGGRFFMKPEHLQNLVQAAVGEGANANNSPFLLGHGALLKQMVLLSVGGLTMDAVTPEVGAQLGSLLGTGPCRLMGPGSSQRAYPLLPHVLKVPTKKKEEKKKQPAGGGQLGAWLEELLASEEQLRAHEFPEEGKEGFVSSSSSGAGKGGILAVDCEMVRTERGLEVGRVTVVDEEGREVMDDLVRPEGAVEDYCTRYSGLTAEMLTGDKVLSFAVAQERFLGLVGSQTVLVGHSLENDLQVMRVSHQRLADTSLLYPHPRGAPFKRSLRDLAQHYLHRTIQAEAGGHCSAEDARTALELFKLKREKGMAFGLPSKDYQSLWERVVPATGRLVYPPELAGPMSSLTALGEESEAVGERMLAAVQEGGTLVVGLTPDQMPLEQSLDVATQLWEGLPAGTLMVVTGGRGVLDRLLELQENRVEEAAAITEEVARIRMLPLWLGVK